MKELTAQRLIQILLKQNSRLRVISSCDIIRIKYGLVEQAIQTSLTSADFRELSHSYPAFISVSETSVSIRKGQQFRQILERRLAYSQDKEVDRIVIEIWKR